MSEPTYIFKKGEGWVPTYTVDIWLKGREIKIGDVIDMYRYLKPEPSKGYKLNSGSGLIKRVTASNDERYYGSSGELEYDASNPNPNIEWHVIKRA